MKSFLVIGMGRFGQRLARRLQELGCDVMIADRDEQLISELAPDFTDAQIGDCTNENVLRSFGVGNFDACIVSIGEDFQSSLEITSQLKELGAKRVISKAGRDIQAKFLLRNGADEVVYPERDMADKLARIVSANNLFDYIELAEDYGIFEITPPESWVGHSIIEVDVRRRHGVNILAIKKGTRLNSLPQPDYVFGKSDHVIISGRQEDILRLTKK